MSSRSCNKAQQMIHTVTYLNNTAWIIYSISFLVPLSVINVWLTTSHQKSHKGDATIMQNQRRFCVAIILTITSCHFLLIACFCSSPKVCISYHARHVRGKFICLENYIHFNNKAIQSALHKKALSIETLRH